MPYISKIAGERTVLYTQQEAADLLGVTDRTIRTYLKEGRIPSVKIKKRTYIWDRHLLQYIRGAKTTKKYQTVDQPQYDTLDFDAPPDIWES